MIPQICIDVIHTYYGKDRNILAGTPRNGFAHGDDHRADARSMMMNHWAQLL